MESREFKLLSVPSSPNVPHALNVITPNYRAIPALLYRYRRNPAVAFHNPPKNPEKTV